MVLERIHSSEDVKRLSSKELPVLAQELRARASSIACRATAAIWPPTWGWWN